MNASMHRDSDRLRICMLTDSYPPVVGGIEAHVHSLTSELERQGHSVAVVTYLRQPANGSQMPGPLAADELSPGVTVHRLSGLRLRLGDMEPVLSPRLGRELERLLGNGSYDVAHSHAFASVVGTVGLWQARRLGLPTVMTKHSMVLERRRPPLSRLALGLERRLVQRWADGVIAVSAGCAAEMAGIRVPVWTIPNGVDCGRWKPDPDVRNAMRASLGYGPDEVVVGFLGRLVPAKGPLILLELAQRLVSSLPRVRFLVVGGGPLEETLKRRVAELGLAGRFDVLGARPWAETPAYLNAMDVFVSPSTAEAFGLALAEAMACGVAAVATSTAGAREIVSDGETGYLASTEVELEKWVATLCREEAVRSRMARAGRASVEQRFDWRVVAARTVEVYFAVVAAQRQARPVRPE